MFFIGIFGIDHASKEMGTENNVTCPACGAYTHFKLRKDYDYFHIFFIPVFRWNVRELAQAHCCGTLLERDGETWRVLTKRMNTCPSCGKPIDPEAGFKYCPWCSHPLR